MEEVRSLKVNREMVIVDRNELLDMGMQCLDGALDLLRYYRDSQDSYEMRNKFCNIIQIVEDASSHIEHYIKTPTNL